MWHVYRLRTSDSIPSAAALGGGRRANRFFVTVSLRRVLEPLTEGEYGGVVAALEASPRKLRFLVLRHELMPDHRRALI